MAVKLRLRRMGKKKQPIYKVVAADSRSPRDGKFLESVGLYNPLTNPSTIEIQEDRVNYWLDNGAQPTDTVKSLLRQKGITFKRELLKKGLSEEQVKAELEQWEKQREAKVKSKSERKRKEEKNVPKENAEEVVEENEKSTAEVKGAASENNPSEEE